MRERGLETQYDSGIIIKKNNIPAAFLTPVLLCEKVSGDTWYGVGTRHCSTSLTKLDYGESLFPTNQSELGWVVSVTFH